MDFIVSPPKFWRTFSWYFNFHQSAIFQVSLSYFFNFHVDTSWHSACIYWFDGKVNMYDVINNLYHFIVSGNVETWNRKQETCRINPTTILFPLDCKMWQIVKTWSMGTHQHLINGYASTLFNEKKITVHFSNLW